MRPWLPKFLIQNLFRIWRRSYEESCSFLQNHHNHILLQIFKAQESLFWIKSNLNFSNIFERVWINLPGLNRYWNRGTVAGPHPSASSCASTASQVIDRRPSPPLSCSCRPPPHVLLRSRSCSMGPPHHPPHPSLCSSRGWEKLPLHPAPS
jgi:hypothetical protein